MRRYLVPAILFFALVALLGCVNDADLLNMVESSPALKEFLAEHPNAQTTARLLDANAVAADTDFMQYCEGVSVEGYYKVALTDPDTGLSAFAFVDTQQGVVCAHRDAEPQAPPADTGTAGDGNAMDDDRNEFTGMPKPVDDDTDDDSGDDADDDDAHEDEDGADDERDDDVPDTNVSDANAAVPDTNISIPADQHTSDLNVTADDNGVAQPADQNAPADVNANTADDDATDDDQNTTLAKEYGSWTLSPVEGTSPLTVNASGTCKTTACTIDWGNRNYKTVYGDFNVTYTYYVEYEETYTAVLRTDGGLNILPYYGVTVSK